MKKKLSPKQKTTEGDESTGTEREEIHRNGSEVKDGKGEKPKKKLSKLTIWTIKIVIITFCLSAVFAYVSEVATEEAHISVAILLLVLLIAMNIIFDAIGVAATACDLAPLLSMSARKVKAAKEAVVLVKNAERVSNICGDVIGDICGIVSGACTVAVALKVIQTFSWQAAETWITIAGSSLVSAITVGGKAICKEIAVKNSKEMIMLCARVIHFFTSKLPKRKKKKHK